MKSIYMCLMNLFQLTYLRLLLLNSLKSSKLISVAFIFLFSIGQLKLII
uniref:Uncharacterized protein n=1 Tax=Anguilla anguilla TaxID=7936 RepID=A0A0E9XCE2_ANGAN